MFVNLVVVLIILVNYANCFVLRTVKDSGRPSLVKIVKLPLERDQSNVKTWVCLI